MEVSFTLVMVDQLLHLSYAVLLRKTSTFTITVLVYKCKKTYSGEYIRATKPVPGLFLTNQPSPSPCPLCPVTYMMVIASFAFVWAYNIFGLDYHCISVFKLI